MNETALQVATEFAKRAQLFAQLWEAAGYPIRFHEYYRGPEAQEAAFQRGASKARFGQSAHNFYLAVDYHFDKYGWNVPKAFWEYGDELARMIGLETGILYGDANHLELSGWKTWKAYFLA